MERSIIQPLNVERLANGIIRYDVRLRSSLGLWYIRGFMRFRSAYHSPPLMPGKGYARKHIVKVPPLAMEAIKRKVEAIIRRKQLDGLEVEKPIE